MFSHAPLLVRRLGDVCSLQKLGRTANSAKSFRVKTQAPNLLVSKSKRQSFRTRVALKQVEVTVSRGRAWRGEEEHLWGGASSDGDNEQEEAAQELASDLIKLSVGIDGGFVLALSTSNFKQRRIFCHLPSTKSPQKLREAVRLQANCCIDLFILWLWAAVVVEELASDLIKLGVGIWGGFVLAPVTSIFEQRRVFY